MDDPKSVKDLFVHDKEKSCWLYYDVYFGVIEYASRVLGKEIFVPTLFSVIGYNFKLFLVGTSSFPLHRVVFQLPCDRKMPNEITTH